MRVMNIGRLNKRITFLKLSDERDLLGQSKKVLKPVKTVWGSLYPVRGAEFYEIQKMQARITHKCYVRYAPEIDENCFIEHKGKTYSIESVIDVDLGHKMLEIMCSEHINKEVMERGTDSDLEWH
ncbi:MAG TPA: phage head closure protein [Methanocorpusculum sp.]|nr:phage head closure protein [Methanocorpusculum sp.]